MAGALVLALAVVGGCGAPAVSGTPGTERPLPGGATTSTPGTPTPTATATTSTPRPSASGTATVRPGAGAGSTGTEGGPCAARDADRSPAVPDRLSLQGASGQAWSFAPLDRSRPVVVEGSVGSDPAWSTSKVLVVAAYLDTVVDGRPQRLDAAARRTVTAALTRSDEDAVLSLRDAIPGRPGSAMTRVLRSVGDRSTVAPDSYQGTMRWSLREQVRFVDALARGRVVSPAASEYLLASMRPVRAHSWGLGTIGATAFKGGWLRRSTPTRQLGVVDGYAVAISTDRGPTAVQTDGDAAHVERMDRLAALLHDRLAWERECGRS